MSDLEFNKKANPNLSPSITEDLLIELFDELNQEFQTMYNISIQRSCMVDLDSSTPKKFSRHWILHLPNGELFSDAREAGVFVKVLVSRLEREQESGGIQSRGHKLLADNLFVNAEDSTDENQKLTRFIGKSHAAPFSLVPFWLYIFQIRMCIINYFGLVPLDLGVYTRNRIFRIIGSTKSGKPADAALRIADANEFPFPAGFDNAKFYLPEMVRKPTGDADDGENHHDDNNVSRRYFFPEIGFICSFVLLTTTWIIFPTELYQV